MTSHLDPYREFQEWLAEGPTAWSDQSLDAVIRRIAVTPQQRRSHRPWSPRPRRVLYAVAGLAAAVIIVAVAWAVLSGQLLPPNLPPAATPEPSARTSAPRSDGNSALLDDGRVLVVSGAWPFVFGERAVALAQVWDPMTGSLNATGRPTEGRVKSTATALYDGRVLVVGGYGGPIPYSNAIASAELWDPATGSFAPAGLMSEQRGRHTATLLNDGRVLVVGGEGRDGATASAELWDAASSTFSPLPPLSNARSGHTATLLPGGRVLVVGGADLGGSLASAELWDPATNAFSATGSLAHERSAHTATLLQDGRVLIVGGRRNGTALASAEVWDPATGSFVAAGTLAQARGGHAAAPLADGRVFLFAGYDGSSFTTSVEFWDPTAATFRTAAPLPEQFFEPSAVLLPDDRRVLVVGFAGQDGPISAVTYDAGAGEATQPTPGATLVCHWDLPGDVLAEVERAGAELGVAVEGPDYAATRGDVRLGVDAFAQAGCDLIVARVLSPEREASAAEALEAHPGQRAVVFGYERYRGRDLPNVLWVSLGADFTSLAVFDAIRQVIDGTFQGGTLSESGLATPAPPFTSSRPPTDGPFSPTGLLAQTGGRGDSVLLPDGRVLILNRAMGMGGTRGTQILDPVSGTTELTGQPAENRFESTATLLRDGRVLVAGGVVGRPDLPAPAIASAEIWDPATAAFTATGSMGEARRNHTATLLPDGHVLVVGGGYDEGAPAVYGLKSHSLTTAEIWDPATGLFVPTGPLREARQYHTATLLPDGRVLVVGGSVSNEDRSSKSLASAEIWDPATGLFTRAGSFVYERNGHTATLLSDGRVLIVGGTSAEIWDPETNTFDEIGGASSWPIASVAVLVPDGRVLLFGDDSPDGSGSVGVGQWDPESGAGSAAPSLTVPISPEMAAVLDDGRVLVIGSDIAAVVYDPGGEE